MDGTGKCLQQWREAARGRGRRSAKGAGQWAEEDSRAMHQAEAEPVLTLPARQNTKREAGKQGSREAAWEAAQARRLQRLLADAVARAGEGAATHWGV